MLNIIFVYYILQKSEYMKGSSMGPYLEDDWARDKQMPPRLIVLSTAKAA